MTHPTLSEHIGDWLTNHTELEYDELAEFKEELTAVLEKHININMQVAIADDGREFAKMSLDLLLAI